MAKFVYKMQNLLNIKKNLENQAKSAYATAFANYTSQQEKLEQMFAKKRQLEDEYRKYAQGNINVRDLIDGQKAIKIQMESIKTQLVEVKVAEKNFETARIRLNQAVKDRKTYEKLREHEFENFLFELSEAEKKEIDELVSYKYGMTD